MFLIPFYCPTSLIAYIIPVEASSEAEKWPLGPEVYQTPRPRPCRYLSRTPFRLGDGIKGILPYLVGSLLRVVLRVAASLIAFPLHELHEGG